MKSVRIEPGNERGIFLIDVVCDCGQNGLTNEATGERSFKHEVRAGCGEQDTVLSCSECGKKYRVHPQGTHIHVGE